MNLWEAWRRALLLWPSSPADVVRSVVTFGLGLLVATCTLS